MLKTLLTIERALPELLKDEAVWTGIYADTEKPHLQRLWRQHEESRIYLHRFEGCMTEEKFPHPHPWPFAVRILEGRYRMALGASSNPDVVPPDVAVVDLSPGCCYEMAHANGWHWIQPLDNVSVTLMVAGPTIWQQNRKRANRPCRELTSEERATIFNVFHNHYPTQEV